MCLNELTFCFGLTQKIQMDHLVVNIEDSKPVLNGRCAHEPLNVGCEAYKIRFKYFVVAAVVLILLS